MALESARQDPLGRVDVSQIIGRGQDPNLNSAPATQALIQAFRDGELTSAEIADRAAKRPLVQAAADPELLAAQKQQALANAGMSQLQLQQAQATAKIPPRIQEMQAELTKHGLATATPPANWTDADSAATIKSWTDLEDWKTQVAKVTAQKEIPVSKEAVVDGRKVLISTSKASGTELDPAAVDEMEKFFATYSKSPKAWIAAGKPAAVDLFGAAGAVTPGVAPTAGVVGATGSVGAPGVIAGAAGAPSRRGTDLGAAPANAPSEGVTKASVFAKRAVDSNEVFANLEKNNFNPATFKNWMQELLVGPLNVFKSPEKQSYDSARASWAQGLLRMESGANITVKEQKWYEDTFFPRVGESKAVQDQKAKMRAGVESIANQLAATTVLDVGALERIRNQAEAVDELSKGGAFTGGGQIVTYKGKQYRTDNSDPANPKLIAISAPATPTPTRPTVEPK